MVVALVLCLLGQVRSGAPFGLPQALLCTPSPLGQETGVSPSSQQQGHSWHAVGRACPLIQCRGNVAPEGRGTVCAPRETGTSTQSLRPLSSGTYWDLELGDPRTALRSPGLPRSLQAIMPATQRDPIHAHASHPVLLLLMICHGSPVTRRPAAGSCKARPQLQT